MKKIFISFSSADSAKMKLIKKIVDGSDFFTAIIATEFNTPGKDLSKKIIDGITDCEYFIPIITSKSVSTQWLNQEIGFAKALNREIIPIVEIQIINSLKGFVHNQLDLSFRFYGNDSDTNYENKKFREVSKELINHIMSVNGYELKKYSYKDIFPGIWQCKYNHPEINGIEDGVEIRENNKYFMRGVHYFNLEKLSVNIKANRIKFTKVASRPTDHRNIENELNIVQFGAKYEGIENGDLKNIRVVYEKISS
ncbi:MAG: toll/interleukin-1 receptor domain-containing protein [Panacibacter sp.]